MAYQNPILEKANLRRLIDVACHHQLVKSHVRIGNRFTLNFTTGIKESWFKESGRILIPYDPFSGGQVAVTHQYESDLLMDQSLNKMHMISRKRWRHASFFRRRLVIQEMVTKLLDEGYLKIKFPHPELLDDLQVLWDTDIWAAHSFRNNLAVYGFYGSRLMPGRKIVEQFSKWGEIGSRTVKDAWVRPYPLYRAIQRLLYSFKDVTRHALMCELCHDSHPRFRTYQQFFCPSLYRAIFQRFEIKNHVIADPCQDFGSKAIAAVMEDNYYFSTEVNKPLADFLGVEFGKLDRDHYDVVLLDYGWVDPGVRLIEDLKKWSRKADMKVVFVPKNRVNELPKPYMSLKVESKPVKCGQSDWIYCYL